MSSRYGHKSTAYNGVTIYLHEKFNVNWTVEQVCEFMIQYREYRGSNPSKHYQKNAEYIQNNFQPFVEYCKKKLT